MLTLLAFVLPLGPDSFAIAAAIGAAGPMSKRGRWQPGPTDAETSRREPPQPGPSAHSWAVRVSCAQRSQASGVAGSPGRWGR
jgi:hypothetical protein